MLYSPVKIFQDHSPPRPLPPSSYYVMSYFLSLTPVDCIESRGTMERIINPFQPLADLLYPVHHNPANSNACLRTTIPSFPTLPPPPHQAEISFYFLSQNSFVDLHLVVKAVKGIPHGFPLFHKGDHYSHTNSPKWSLYIFIKNKLREFGRRSIKAFSLRWLFY